MGKPIKYYVDEKGCHICTSHYHDRYVHLWHNNRIEKMHRVVYANFYLNGERVGDEFVVRHKCDNSICINPLHLEIGTQKDNIHDMIARNRLAIGGRHGMAKLNEEKVIAIFNEVGTNQAIGDKYNVSASIVSNIKNKKRWKHVVSEL
jgi:hypothetical protein